MRFLLGVLLLSVASSLENGLALTPPRGWRSWNLFGPQVSQPLMESIMEAMVTRTRLVNGVPTSLFDLGYTDVGLDDAWQKVRSGPGGVGFHDATGNPIVDTTRFPSLASMTAKAHSLNLTAGWYANNCISADPSGNVSHFLGDVAAFRRFGFDSYKLDSCSGQKDISLWSSLLASSGPPVVIENCHNGPFFPQHGYKVIPGSDAWGAITWCPFNFYRTSVDIVVLYGSIFGVNLPSTIEFSRANLSFPGCWAYPDSAFRAPLEIFFL